MTPPDAEGPREAGAARFCSGCGEKASGRFCWSCGKPLQGEPGSPTPAAPEVGPIKPAGATEWSAEVDYRTLIGIPEVRERIARQADLSRKGMSAEEFLSTADKVVGPLLSAGVPLQSVAKLGHRLGSSLGIRTGKKRTERLGFPVGRVMVATLCSLARRGMTIDSVKQGDDGCVFQAAIPSSVFIFAGTLTVAVSGDAGSTQVEAGATVSGQMFDWGTSRAAMRNLFADIDVFAPANRVG